MVRPTLALLAALVLSRAGPAPAAEEPLLLATPRQVESLCASLTPVERMRFRGDALERGKAEVAHRAARSVVYGRRYRVEIPGQRIAFAPYDEEDEELLLSSRAVLTGVRGALRVWASEDAELTVKVSRAEARRVLDAQRAGLLALSLVFDLPDVDESGSPCAHAAGSRVYTLGVEPISWRYLAKGEVLARGGEGADRPLVTAAQGARPTVEVGEAVGGRAELRQPIAARTKDLATCYGAALRRDPSLDGILVLEVELREGRPLSTRVSADSMQDAALAACVQAAVGKASFPKGSAGVSVPIHFGLQAPAAAAQPQRQ